VIIFTNQEDVRSILSANGYEFAGTNIKIELLAPTGPRSATFSFSDTKPRDESSASAKEELTATLKSFLARRYDANAKLLDLSSIVKDQGIQAIGLSDLNIKSKFFTALMLICDEVFPAKDVVESITLKENELKDVGPVTALSQTFPDLKNLDLCHNQLATMRNISRWQHKFKNLEHIVLTGNPLEESVPDFKAQLVRWFPKLHLVDLNELPADMLEAARAKKTPPKVQAGAFQDQGGVAETFLKNFFAGYDNNRQGLVEYYYDDTSRFSLDVNTKALRDPSQKTQPHEWESYIRLSRNLLRINNLGARMKRSHQGTAAVREIFGQLPATLHPDFATESQKWLVECQIQYGLPDPTGQYPDGVNGLLVTVHGEFKEVDNNKLRSFDRTFILGPGGPNGVRVVNDMITIRAYGGIKAYQVSQEPTPPITDATINAATEQDLMIVEMMKQTGMNAEYSRLCLEQSGYAFADALVAFANAKANIPAEAYVQQAV